MKIQEVKQKVLHNDTAIEYDNGNIEMLRKALKFIFPEDCAISSGECKFYSRYEYIATEWKPENYFHGKSIPLSSITFPDEITVDQIRQLRKEFSNDWDFAQNFDKLINQQKENKNTLESLGYSFEDGV